MNTIYITETGRLSINDGNPKPVEPSRNSVSNVFLIKEDSKVICSYGGQDYEFDAKAGNVLVTFYEKRFPNRVILIDSKEWSDNLIKHEEYEQQLKEEWAKRNSDVNRFCDECNECKPCTNCSDKCEK